LLRNVLVSFLGNADERQLDLPLLFLLPAMGFYDLHLVHGQVEFGRDVIAKGLVNGTEVQYTIQSKYRATQVVRQLPG
jgi:hypothetical protein